MSERVADVEPGARIVVRGLAASDGATSAELGADLDRLLARSRRASLQSRQR